MIRFIKRLLALFATNVKPFYSTISKPFSKSRIFIYNNHQWMRGTLVVLLVVMVGALFLVQADEFAQQSRERERIIDQQTLILCTLIIWENVEVTDVAEIRDICREEINRFDVEQSSSNGIDGRSGSDNASDSSVRIYWEAQRHEPPQQSSNQPGGRPSSSGSNSSVEGNSGNGPAGVSNPGASEDSGPGQRPLGIFRSEFLERMFESRVLQ